jgi:uncharacterized Zn-finger protein
MAKDNDQNVCEGVEMTCPGCHRPLKVPRIQLDPDKPLVCGGCGQRFACSDLSGAARSGETA